MSKQADTTLIGAFVLGAVALDKKRVGAHVPFVLVRAPGEVEFGCELAPEEIAAAVGELVV